MDALGLEPSLVAASEPPVSAGGDIAPSLFEEGATAPEFKLAAEVERHGGLRGAFDRCADGLYRFILVRAGGDRDAAEELLQQTCVEAARSRKAPATHLDCEAFLFGIARNLVRKHWRRMKRRGVPLPAHDVELGSRLAAMMEAGPIGPDVLAGREVHEQLMLAITALPSADQQLVFAFYFDGRSCVEIAAETGTTAKAVESRLHRLRARLRAMLRGEDHC